MLDSSETDVSLCSPVILDRKKELGKVFAVEEKKNKKKDIPSSKIFLIPSDGYK